MECVLIKTLKQVKIKENLSNAIKFQYKLKKVYINLQFIGSKSCKQKKNTFKHFNFNTI